MISLTSWSAIESPYVEHPCSEGGGDSESMLFVLGGIIRLNPVVEGGAECCAECCCWWWCDICGGGGWCEECGCGVAISVAALDADKGLGFREGSGRTRIGCVLIMTPWFWRWRCRLGSSSVLPLELVDEALDPPFTFPFSASEIRSPRSARPPRDEDAISPNLIKKKVNGYLLKRTQKTINNSASHIGTYIQIVIKTYLIKASFYLLGRWICHLLWGWWNVYRRIKNMEPKDGRKKNQGKKLDINFLLEKQFYLVLIRVPCKVSCVSLVTLNFLWSFISNWHILLEIPVFLMLLYYISISGHRVFSFHYCK